ncbi:glycosyltransferase family 2 protein [Chryseobacterium sp. SC28]|uniref:glycosyltransferase family 2 protein n=1 Tax=Chryseobacterium sp. SC28 TaxID=2268028 RepID=UPI000F649893|nr:glycosyltransferase family 2 protein [Chryseobacterium sp. SC28]RRQ45335.1 glycosyltransferase family 2 protein [Chryseobacterium sp. SC28]
MISVCMTTYNGEKHIKEQLDSILNQLSPDDEVIISDDGSTDDTVNIINSYSDSRIILYHHKKKHQKFNFGYTAKNFENALNKSKGDIIFLADQDDVWLPNKVQQQTAALQKADLVLSDCTIVDESLNTIIPSKFKLEKIKTGFWRNIYKPGYLGCCMAFRRDLLKDILPIPENVPHDLWIGLISNNKGKVELLNIPTVLYRRHDNNVSATSPLFVEKQSDLPKNNNTLYFKLLYRFFILKEYLFSRYKQIIKFN